VRQVGYLPELYENAWSEKIKKKTYNFTYCCHYCGRPCAPKHMTFGTTS